MLFRSKRFAEALEQTTNPWGVEQVVNVMYEQAIDYIQDLIAINYVGRVDIDSAFWRYAKPTAIKRLHNSSGFQSWVNDCIQTGIKGYGLHGRELMREYINGYKIVLPELVA